jgi:hypothetical protein
VCTPRFRLPCYVAPSNEDPSNPSLSKKTKVKALDLSAGFSGLLSGSSVQTLPHFQFCFSLSSTLLSCKYHYFDKIYLKILCYILSTSQEKTKFTHCMPFLTGLYLPFVPPLNYLQDSEFTLALTVFSFWKPFPCLVHLANFYSSLKTQLSHYCLEIFLYISRKN